MGCIASVLGIQGFGFRVQGLGFRPQRLGCWGFDVFDGPRVKGSQVLQNLSFVAFKVFKGLVLWGFRLGIQALGFIIP